MNWNRVKQLMREGCNCAEYDGFPLNCYRVADFIKGEET